MPTLPSREFTRSFAKSWPISDLPGISTEDCQQLKRLEILTTRDLLRHSATFENQAKLAQKLHLHLHHIQKWRALSDLAMLPSIGTDYCGLLLHAGVISTAQLADRLPGQLYRQILKLQVSTLKRPDLCPNAGLVELWIQQAKQFQVAKTHQARKLASQSSK